MTFGNPTREQMVQMQAVCMVDDLFDVFASRSHPDNDSHKTRDELSELLEKLTDITVPENALRLKSFRVIENHTQAVFSGKLHGAGIEIGDIFKEIEADIMPLINKLRFSFGRPRPRQLAAMFDMALFPYESKNDNTPSYPAANSVLSIVVASVLINHHPQHTDLISRIMTDALNAPIYLGLHYPSDNDFAHEVADQILRFPAFTRKYKI